MLAMDGHNDSQPPRGSASLPQCDSCTGSGEYPTDYGVVDCPDCGGAGYLPTRHTLVEWRMRDIERANDAGLKVTAADVRWLLSEVRQAREALRSVVALSHDVAHDPSIATQVRGAAERTLGENGRRWIGPDDV